MDNKENEIVAEKDTFRAVIYTDGSMYHPNNNQIGYTGSSAHGYIYNIKSKEEFEELLVSIFNTKTIQKIIQDLITVANGKLLEKK